ncbi:MAG: glutamine amidotransferase [Cellvibrionaceae bacterium]
MSKPFLIIQLRPEAETAHSEFAAIKRYGELADDAVVRWRVEATGLPPVDLDRFAGIIVGGSPFDISTPREQKSAIQRKLEADFHRLLDEIVARDFPFLGCCSGNGLLGSYCGTSISRRFAEPVGGTDVTLTDAGESDPLLQGFPSPFRVLTGHKEACDSVPAGCVLLASNAQCPVQMFRLKKNIYATQFHPEADAQGFTVRIKVYRAHGYFPPESAAQLIEAIRRESTPEAQSILKRFVALYRDD